MGFRLVLYLAILFIGIFIGYKEISHKKLLEYLNHLQMAALVGLLFIMGIRIGVDDKIIKSLGSLGLQALILSVFAIVGSVIMVFLYRKMMGLSKKGEKE